MSVFDKDPSPETQSEESSSDEAKSIFLNAIEIDSQDSRDAFIGAACRHNVPLRREVERLLAHHGDVGSFLQTPPHDALVAPTVDQSTAEMSGAHIGPYKLLQKIGEGGMGVVYMAEQKVPVKRRVALKIIKPGMDTEQVIARFEAERQALAMMDHPGIAKVLEARATLTGSR